MLTIGRRTVSLKLHADGMIFGQVRHERLKLVHLRTTNSKNRYIIFKLFSGYILKILLCWSRGARHRAAAKQLHQTSESPGRKGPVHASQHMHICCSSSGTMSTSTRRPAELHSEDSGQVARHTAYTEHVSWAPPWCHGALQTQTRHRLKAFRLRSKLHGTWQQISKGCDEPSTPTRRSPGCSCLVLSDGLPGTMPRRMNTWPSCSCEELASCSTTSPKPMCGIGCNCYVTRLM